MILIVPVFHDPLIRDRRRPWLGDSIKGYKVMGFDKRGNWTHASKMFSDRQQAKNYRRSLIRTPKKK